ncbi:glycoside hydrolase family 92 protein [Flavobacteriaceae bacterium]|nr:glycoside hydrolase family 92 protein [Flavobacteriaceae bacterium]
MKFLNKANIVILYILVFFTALSSCTKQGTENVKVFTNYVSPFIGTGEYEIGSPLFEKTTLNVSDDTFFIIEAEHVSDTNIYIQSATLNGNDFNQTVISHQQIIQGGTLKFVMGPKPNKNWGIKN